MAVPEEMGGYGASLLDLSLVAELHGRHVAPAPLIEAQVAVRLLASVPDPTAKRALHLCLTGSSSPLSRFARPYAVTPSWYRLEPWPTTLSYWTKIAYCLCPCTAVPPPCET